MWGNSAADTSCPSTTSLVLHERDLYQQHLHLKFSGTFLPCVVTTYRALKTQQRKKRNIPFIPSCPKSLSQGFNTLVMGMVSYRSCCSFPFPAHSQERHTPPTTPPRAPGHGEETCSPKYRKVHWHDLFDMETVFFFLSFVTVMHSDN